MIISFLFLKTNMIYLAYSKNLSAYSCWAIRDRIHQFSASNLINVHSYLNRNTYLINTPLDYYAVICLKMFCGSN